jgi:hypothetical protein
VPALRLARWVLQGTRLPLRRLRRRRPRRQPARRRKGVAELVDGRGKSGNPETVEHPVIAAIRAELPRVEWSTSVPLTPEQAALVDRTMAMVAKLPRVEIDSDDPTGFLYDEDGLPC